MRSPAEPDPWKAFRLQQKMPLEDINTAISVIRKSERNGMENPEAGAAVMRLRVPENFI